MPESLLQQLVRQLLVLDRALREPGAGFDEHGFIEKLLLTVDAAPVLLSYVDSAERYRFCNQAYERWFGEPRERVLGRTLREVLGETAYQEVATEVRAVLSGQRVRFERSVPYRAGGTRMVLADYLPHVLPEGRVAGFVVAVMDVTELRHSQQAGRISSSLRESEDRLRLAVEAAALGTFDFDLLTGERRWDARCRELLELSPTEPLSYELFLACIHPEDRARVDATVKRGFDPAGSGRDHLEYRVRGLRTQRERWIEAHGQVFFDGGRPTRFLGTMRDITADRRARLRADRLHALSSALSRVMLPEEVARAVVSEGAAALEALSASLVVVSEDRSAFELRAAHGFPGELMEGWRRFPLDTPVMYREAVRTGQPVLYPNLADLLRDYPGLEGSPALRGRAFVALPLRVDERIIGAFGFSFAHERPFPPEDLLFMESIGQQCALALERARLYEAERQARAEAERLRDRLAAERGLLEAVLQQLPVGVVIAEPGGRLVQGSAALETIWGHPFIPSEGIPEYTAYQGYRPDGTAYGPEEWPLARSLLHGEAVLREPVTVVHPDGTRRQIEISSTLVKDAEGRAVAGVAVSTDVTAHHRLQEELRREADVREKLLGIVGHDLRSPLQAIATSGALLLRGEPLTPTQHKRVLRVLTSVQRMDHLIRDLLDFARVRQGGHLPIQRRPTRLEDACRAVIDELQAASPGRRIDLEVRGEAEGEWDLDRMAQLVGNLLSNALKHGDPDSPVQVRVEGQGPEVALEVANQGPPIDPELRPRIFEPFTRASADGDALKGVGLGLFIVHEIVTAHGGRIEVRSSAEAGTVFRVTLPRTPAA